MTRETTSSRPAVAFYIERRSDGGYFVAVLVDASGHQTFRYMVDACADQAAETATRHGKRPLQYLGMRGYREGAMVPIEDDMRCPVNPHDWTWANHHPCHGALDRIKSRLTNMAGSSTIKA